ncbi:hypothetical protein BU25DRAFT_274367 [Macroventuria anomochaeta]|uniref:Uncharacterized protein n=1 Tax=Macroventuria anomochaeta TaxID=301207 RepID=A0ACB6S9L0_9PLEO|nr:uncharacterized protein BU25DRAFT_274367 [Macroventuria anomochaeta]KAF2629797.1 hypothetical protein BU25DRAFT_274367 [Macroventuria anomochaeta]
MSIILTVCGIIVLFAFFLDEILAFLFKFRRLRNDEDYDYAYAELQAGSTLQLQRLAHESVGAGTWTGATDVVPVIDPGDTLAVLDLRQRGHPRLTLSSHELTHIDTETFVNKRPSARYTRLQSSDAL